MPADYYPADWVIATIFKHENQTSIDITDDDLEDYFKVIERYFRQLERHNQFGELTDEDCDVIIVMARILGSDSSPKTRINHVIEFYNNFKDVYGLEKRASTKLRYFHKS